MGYYTLFELEAYPDVNFPKEPMLSEVIIETMFDESKTMKKSQYKYSDLEDVIKWYEWGNDMTSLSLEYPDYIFVVYGDGEESDDKWKTVFYNGKSTSVSRETYYPSMDLTEVGLKDPDDWSAPSPEPENAFFFSKE